MNDTIALVERLRRTATRLSEWRAEAARLRATFGLPDANRATDIGRTIVAIERETAAVDDMIAEIERMSRGASGPMAELTDSLRLLLMEFTELSLLPSKADRRVAAVA